MAVVKRYPNRKLYDTEARQYITLEGIAVLIRQGQEVTVVDHASGEDLTALTLTQVILEQEKKRSGFLPQPVLTGLIQAGGDTMGALRRALAAPLNLAWQVDDEIERRLQALMTRGELASEEGRRLREALLGAGPRQATGSTSTEDGIVRALARRDLPTREDVEGLSRQLEALAAKVESLKPPPAPG